MKKIKLEIIREENQIITSSMELIKGGIVSIIQCSNNDCGTHSGSCNINKCTVHTGMCDVNSCGSHCQVHMVGCPSNCSCVFKQVIGPIG